MLSGSFAFAVTSITVFELWKGDNSGEDHYWLNLFSKMEMLDFDVDSGKIAGNEYLKLKHQGQMIDVEDILIAGVAKRHSLRVATTNQAHYRRIDGLGLVDFANV